MRDEAELWAARWGVPIALAVLAIAAKAVLSAERATWRSLCRTVFVGLFVGASVNVWLIDAGLFTDGTRGAVVGVSAVLAEDLLLALLRTARKFLAEPVLIDWLLASFARAASLPPKSSTPPDEPKP